MQEITIADITVQLEYLSSQVDTLARRVQAVEDSYWSLEWHVDLKSEQQRRRRGHRKRRRG
jgi:hypothetical protein